MKYRDEFQRADLVAALVDAINKINIKEKLTIMEVCGTHTHSIARFGISSMFPDIIDLRSGPGCPVCVTPQSYIDKVIALSQLPDVIITTFGDLFRVPGSYSSLREQKGRGADIRVVYSPFDALRIASQNPAGKVIFPGVGFETTVPAVAAVVQEASKNGVDNFSVLSGFKTLPAALKFIAESPEININGLLTPGHVSVITGISMFKDLSEKYQIPSVVTGFEPVDILEGVKMLVEMIVSGHSDALIQYSRAVRPGGNKKAQEMISEVFQLADSEWRGLGLLPSSGLEFKNEYARFDADKLFEIKTPQTLYPEGCICGAVLTGVKTPGECQKFGSPCTPEHPAGACMVSSEGTCAAYYRYKLLELC
jgi:hydrogenase expression/formation protein HypD